jgi:hypothetical protein
MKTTFKGLVLAFATIIPAAIGSQAMAHDGHFHGGYGNYGVYSTGVWNGGYNFTQQVYHPPTIQYRKVYHPTKLHWTPKRGLHSHGHFDYVPTYVPGHFDTLHNGHVHSNPWFHY